jgi:hypothetical protein
MKNKILILIAISLIAFVAIVRYYYKSKLEDFKETIASIENSNLESINKEKQKKLEMLNSNDTTLFRLFSSQFVDTMSFTKRDTTFSFLYLSGKVTMKVPTLEYIECLYKKCIIDQKNEIALKLIEPKIIALQKKYQGVFDSWYSKFKNEKLFHSKLINIDCGVNFDSLYEISFDKEAWSDFDRFLSDYEKQKLKVDNESKKAEDELDRLASKTRSKLNSSVINYFNNKLKGSHNSLIITTAVPISFKSSSIGNINYKLSKSTVNKEKFNKIANEAFEEQWQYNSLDQGSMPWAYCYGSRNVCNGYDCSQISILSGSSDVLVTIKNEEGAVCRHAYIKSGTKFKFNLPNGRYQVFFYSGNGWNPNKFMKNTSCGELKGGFVLNESFTKDTYQNIFNQILSYTLIEQVNGNLSKQPSSMNEAL